MAEVEIHAEHEHAADDFGKRVGIAVGVIGIVLAVVTICSHRAHTNAVIERTKANDQWSYYQAKKLREHLLDVSSDLVRGLSSDPSRTQTLVEKFDTDRERYHHDTEEIQKEAKHEEDESDREERRALRLDMGEGFLELGLVLSSLYFLAKRRFFPILGGAAAVIGSGLGIAALFV